MNAEAKAIPYYEFIAIHPSLEQFGDMSESRRERAGAAFLVGMAFCDGKGVKQSDKLAMFILVAADNLGHPNAVFELGELYSKKRSWLRQDAVMADVWYSKKTLDEKNARELTQNYALLLRGSEEANSSLQSIPKDVINEIRNFSARFEMQSQKTALCRA
ncbi:MAG: hypothetical protein K0R08_804 [Solimicrobium sp.]|jgi:hypothetical protein|nr:hypothetical protein [Solimicrobium sp.]